MSNVLLVSESKIKNFTTINQNVDTVLLQSCIQIAQDLHLQPVIGTKMLNYYYDLVINVQQSGGTMSQADRTLLDEFISPVVLWAAHYEALPEIWRRLMNKGIQVGSSEQSNPVDLKTLQYFRDASLNRYQFYIQRLLDYIQTHSGDYPLYFQYTSGDGMPSQNTVAFSGIHFPNNNMRKPPIKGEFGYNLPAYRGGLFDCPNC